MSASLGIDARHFAAEELAVRGGVFPLIDSYIVMNHLMDDSVLYEFFGEVESRVDAKDEVLISQGSKEP